MTEHLEFAYQNYHISHALHEKAYLCFRVSKESINLGTEELVHMEMRTRSVFKCHVEKGAKREFAAEGQRVAGDHSPDPAPLRSTATATLLKLPVMEPG